MSISFESTIQGTCKDCGNGTLNNELNHAFDIAWEGEYDEDGQTHSYISSATCSNCGSNHIDLL